MALSYTAGLALVERRCTAVEGFERVALDDALLRILGANITAPRDYPPADNSAVDGYAFRRLDLMRGAPFQLAGVSAAGHPYQGQVGPGEAIRILTGALVPQGADAVAMQEDVTRKDGEVLIPADVRAAHIRRAAEDIKTGEVILKAGVRLGPAELGLLASLGIAAVTARRRPRIAVMSIGDELLRSGETARADTIYESNRAVLMALLSRLGIVASDHGIVPDRESAIRQALARATKSHDGIVTSAGVSVGDEDHVRQALLSIGEIDFAGLAIKPGKPLVLGHVAGTPFFGLPGNPVAMMIGFLMLARHGLLGLAGVEAKAPPRFFLPADFTLQRKPGVREFLNGALKADGAGMVVRLFPRAGAGSVSAMARSDGLIEIAEELTWVEPGMIVPFLPFGLVGL